MLFDPIVRSRKSTELQPKPNASDPTGPTLEELHRSAAKERRPVPSSQSPSESIDASERDEDLIKLLILVRCGGCGEPVPEDRVRVTCWGAPEPQLNATEAMTDASGTCEVLIPGSGRVTVRSSRGGNASIEGQSERENRIEVVIPNGRDIEGRVVDEMERPVAGADICLTEMPVTTSARDGTFFLRCVGAGTDVSARATGYQPSSRFQMPSAQPTTVQVLLVLKGPGAAVHGRVLSRGQVPVVGATVLVQQLGDNRDAAHDEYLPSAAVFRLSTDHNGQFDCQGTPRGRVALTARAPGFAVWEDELDLTSGSRRDIVVILDQGAILEGIVKDESGQPVGGVIVGVHPYWKLNTPSTVSALDGRFHLSGIPPGGARVDADGGLHGRTQIALNLQLGETRWWDARLQQGESIQGKVVLGSDTPVEGWLVVVPDSSRPTAWLSSSRTNTAGEFILRDCPIGPNRLDVYGLGDRLLSPVARVEGIYGGAKDLLIVVSQDALPSAYFEGRLTDTAGKGIKGARIHVHNQETRRGAYFDATLAAFRIGPMLPGRYELLAMAPGYGTRELGEFFLSSGDAIQLGTTILSAGAGVTVRIEDSDGRLVTYSVRCQIIDVTGSVILSETISDGEASFDTLKGGGYTVRVVIGGSVGTLERSIVATEGTETRVVLVAAESE